ncbi:KH domain-containing protein [Sebaldella sp. S0638]|uniref:KH domain-containing protein n=1 Tax=Sebaldella sp. S0638 TaxID=2957809 RepID=UPI00209F8CFE|nr:KH domain-containing protein [Sebaldella sp. S0638]MCP1223825.1 KH domain-containing protein [Sebaldella sp. S0638]
MEIRDLEKTGYFGYLFFIKYDGTKFDSFDENKDMRSVKGEFKKLLSENNISYYKGVQQAGRTDKDVSAKENILYINTKQELNLSKFENNSDTIEIFDIKKTLPYLELPKLIEKRHYIYRYPADKIKNNISEINKRCTELSGKHDVSGFTTKKGKELKEKVRELTVYYENEELHFLGSSFMPQQVRIMSGYILNNKKQPLEGKYLTLEKMIFSQELEDMIIHKDNVINEINVEKIERNKEFIFFYVKKSKKGEVIGNKGKNIKKLREKYGKIIIKEL